MKVKLYLKHVEEIKINMLKVNFIFSLSPLRAPLHVPVHLPSLYMYLHMSLPLYVSLFLDISLSVPLLSLLLALCPLPFSCPSSPSLSCPLLSLCPSQLPVEVITVALNRISPKAGFRTILVTNLPQDVDFAIRRRMGKLNRK